MFLQSQSPQSSREKPTQNEEKMIQCSRGKNPFLFDGLNRSEKNSYLLQNKVCAWHAKKKKEACEARSNKDDDKPLHLRGRFL